MTDRRKDARAVTYANRRVIARIAELMPLARVDSTDLITVAEAARILEVQRSTVRHHVRNGRLDYIARGVLDRRQVLHYRDTRQKRNRGITVRRVNGRKIDNTGLYS